MDICEFKRLSDAEQLAFVIYYGTFLMNRLEDGFSINLYGLSKFYVEIWFNQSNNKVVKLLTFKSIDRLHVFIDQIKLNLDEPK